VVSVSHDLKTGDLSDLLRVFKTKGGERARSLGVVKRQRKVDIVALVFALVLGFERGARRSLASFRRAYCSSTGVALAPSTFYGRFTPEFSELMKQLTTHAGDDHASPRVCDRPKRGYV